MTKLSAKVVGYTKPVVYDLETPEELIAYCARVSSGRPQEEWGDNYEGLLNYCIRNKHWSVFDMADIVVEDKLHVTLPVRCFDTKVANFRN